MHDTYSLPSLSAATRRYDWQVCGASTFVMIAIGDTRMGNEVATSRAVNGYPYMDLTIAIVLCRHSGSRRHAFIPCKAMPSLVLPRCFRPYALLSLATNIYVLFPLLPFVAGLIRRYPSISVYRDSSSRQRDLAIRKAHHSPD